MLDQNMYTVEAWSPDSSDGSKKVSTRIMQRDWNPHTGDHEWRYKRHTFSDWDWSLDFPDNQKIGVTRTIRMDIQKDPIKVIYVGDTARGRLWLAITT
jgi:hypothetical protein